MHTITHLTRRARRMPQLIGLAIVVLAALALAAASSAYASAATNSAASQPRFGLTARQVESARRAIHHRKVKVSEPSLAEIADYYACVNPIICQAVKECGKPQYADPVDRHVCFLAETGGVPELSVAKRTPGPQLVGTLQSSALEAALRACGNARVTAQLHSCLTGDVVAAYHPPLPGPVGPLTR